MGYGKKEIANEITDLRQAVRVMRAGMTDSESDRLESIRRYRELHIPDLALATGALQYCSDQLL